MQLDIETKLKLNNNAEIPIFGLGVWRTGVGQQTRDAVTWALEAGYRHIDTAAFYGNEKDVGDAVRDSGMPREEIFITTKLWNSDHGYDKALKAFDTSMDKLGLDYVDLYLIHWPEENLRKDSWKALEKIYRDGRSRAIGVSNYTIRHLKEVFDYGEVIPAVNQVEFHPYLYQKELLQFCNDNNIKLEAYSPLTKGKKLDDPKLAEITQKYSKSPAQILIRWCLQKNVIVIPKSARKEHILQNADVFDFEISEGDMARLDSFNRDYRCAWDPSDAK
ncbi:MAG: aldo/keto reductase [candidate division Zixibacteria bacterium]|nr:aldo/keto reductase [candidate division Zixibacteria bacterium]